MAWTTPRTWVDGEIVTADIMNTHVRDNLDYLKERLDGTATQYVRTATDYTTTSTTLTAVDGTNMALALTTDGSDVLVTFTGYASISTGTEDLTMAVLVDATPYEIITQELSGAANPFAVSFTYIFTGLSAAAHTFTLQWKTTGATATIHVGTTLFDVREMIGLVA